MGAVTEVLPRGDLLVVVLRWGLQDVDGHGVARVVSEAEHLWAHQGVLNERQLGTNRDLDEQLMGAEANLNTTQLSSTSSHSTSDGSAKTCSAKLSSTRKNQPLAICVLH